MAEKMIPRILHGSPTHMRQQVTDRMPMTRPAMAIELFLWTELGPRLIVAGAAEATPASAAANSGSSDNDFHSVPPSGSTLVWALARLSAIHDRNWSALTCPY